MLKILLDIITIITGLCGAYFLIKYFCGKDYKVINDLYRDYSFKKLFYQTKTKSNTAKENKQKIKEE
jgi:hypothetical protein